MHTLLIVVADICCYSVFCNLMWMDITRPWWIILIFLPIILYQLFLYFTYIILTMLDEITLKRPISYTCNMFIDAYNMIIDLLWWFDNLPTTTTSWCVKNIVNFTSNVYQLCFTAIFLLIPEESRNEISTACSWGSGRYLQRIWKKSIWRGQRSKYLQRCGSCVLYRMKPYKNSNESPFFKLQDGAFSILSNI